MVTIEPIAAFSDNYIWLLRGVGLRVAVVDPGDADPVIARLERDRLELAAILLTHHHADHIGGVAALRARYPQAEVWGPDDPRIGGVDRALGDGDRVVLPEPGVALEILAVPGHTSSHIAFYSAEDGVLFCGDTLFACGCGRVFDGTFEQLADSLMRIARLPPTTRIYCAHEYTLANIGFAEWVEPDNSALARRRTADSAARARGEPTLPSELASERATNPFLRLDEPGVKAAAERHAGQPLDGYRAVFRELRSWKDREYD